MKMYTIILCLLFFNCTNTISKKEKNNVTDKTIIMNDLDFKDIMRFGKLEAIKKYGKPFRQEQFTLTYGLPEFRVELLNIYTKKECQSK